MKGVYRKELRSQRIIKNFHFHPEGRRMTMTTIREAQRKTDIVLLLSLMVMGVFLHTTQSAVPFDKEEASSIRSRPDLARNGEQDHEPEVKKVRLVDSRRVINQTSKLWFPEMFLMPRFKRAAMSEKEWICEDPKWHCPAGHTCCISDKAYGCCPLRKAVCCGDHISCCPMTYICKRGLSICQAGDRN